MASTTEPAREPATVDDRGVVQSPEHVPNEQQKGRTVVRGTKAPEIPLFERKNWLLHLHYVRKDYERCKVLIQELLTETSGQCEYAVYIKGLILRQEGDLNESLRFFQQAVQLNPNNPSNVKQVARSLFLLGSYKTALATYSEAELLTQDWEVLHNKGVCYIHLKDYEEAIDTLTKAIQLSPQIVSFKELGRSHLIKGDIHKAIETYRKAIKHNPEDPELLASLGLLYLQIDSSQKAFECLGSALTFDPINYKAILAAGSIIQSHSDNDVALSKYRIAAQTSPESPHLWNNIGMCFYGKSKFVAAISCLKRATYLAPFEWKILYNLGLVHLAMSQHASAFHFLRSAQRLEPKSYHILMLLGIALAHLDDTENALRAYGQAIQLNIDDPLVYLNYAIALYNDGDVKGAAVQYRKYQSKSRSLDEEEDPDPEIQEVSYKLGAILQIGEASSKMSATQQKQQERGGEEEEVVYNKIVRQADGKKVTVQVKAHLKQSEK